MPRKSREKHPHAIFHIMSRSESEFLLFRDDDDKDYYLGLLKRYTDKYKCGIYAYCLMDNHLHLHLDPKGFDVSKFMHCLNTAYVRYYNHKYKRHGHVFQGRFESRILDTDEYNLAVSAYIHNNPHDIEGYSGREEAYKYSSYGIYLGIRRDLLGLIDKSFIMKLFNIENHEQFAEKYFSIVSHQRDVGSFKKLKKSLSTAIQYEYVSGRDIIARDLPVTKVISFISTSLMLPKWAGLAPSGKRKLQEFRAFSAYVLRVLCGLGYRQICSSMHNITISGCSRMFTRGYELLSSGNPMYQSVFDELAGLSV
ncbi:REP element-mobilizing transposase RayT [Anaerobacterium chartisolvens]|uniref:REP element-mobilizing transposase RayT n=1 Tax=Anaerobacterium chartisolvens TaxID=1297424 RepID=A0A369BF59_9FIRM|nr:transposase [Anaerobacterium chartisolvens]RCX20183.1 REP element-mobilizing transposase RayT [Anaerobacterium chartisolvens]